MKKILSITLLITAIILCSCKEESLLRLGKDAEKRVKLLSYSFDANKDGSSVKSDFSSGSIKPANKVLATEIFEVCGESFTAMLIEEDSPIETKATYQNVEGSSIYTFYRYKNSEIRQQSIPTKEQGTNTFFVPQDKATNYGMIFMSKAEGMGNPNTITPTTINTSTKEITYNASFNENVCYVTFDRETMPTSNPIALISFTPVFSQIGISIPAKVVGTTISVEKVSLVSGAQEKATVKATYNSEETKNIRVSYDSVSTNYTVDLAHSLNATNDTTFLSSGGKLGYYNIIPNGNNAQVYIELRALGITAIKKDTIKFKDVNSNPISFSCGKRYTIKIENEVKPHIVITPETTKLKYGLTQQLTAKLVYPDGTGKDITSEAKWEVTNSAKLAKGSSEVIITITKEDTTKITATYNGLKGTASIVPEIYMRLTEKDYYMWDAYLPYDKDNGYGIYPPWGRYSSSYHPGKGVAPSTQNFISAYSYDDACKYLGNEVYWSETNGLIYTLLGDGKFYCDGLWLKKGSPNDKNVTPRSTRIPIEKLPTNPDEYFFLPNCGHFGNDPTTSTGGARYWLRTSDPYSSTNAYFLRIVKTSASVISGGRNLGCIPLKDFDPAY